jgi:hypothetical protein
MLNPPAALSGKPQSPQPSPILADGVRIALNFRENALFPRIINREQVLDATLSVCEEDCQMLRSSHWLGPLKIVQRPSRGIIRSK